MNRLRREDKMQADLNSGIDFDELDTLVADDVSAFPRLAVRQRAARNRSAVTDSEQAPPGLLLWRLVKNTAPQLAADVLSLAVSGLLAELCVWLVARGAGVHWGVAAVAALPLVFAYWLVGLYSGVGVHPVTELREVFQINTIALGAAAIGTFFTPPLALWCVGTWIGSIALVPLNRNLARRWCAGRAWWGHPVIIISAGEIANGVADVMLRAPASGLRPVLVTDPSGECRSSALPVENETAKVERFVRRNAIRHAVMWLPDLPHNQLPAMVDRYSRLIPHLLIASDSAALPSLWRATRNCGRFSGMEVRNGRILAPLQIIKRLLDITVASVAVLLSAPLVLAIVAAIKLGSDGPVLFGHTRIGAKGRPFFAWKFRTMYTDANLLLHQHLRDDKGAMEEWQRDHKLRDDPRITPLGRYLRKWSLDELPQIWNVLKGDMSLVGPRPIVHAEIVRYGDVIQLYTSVKPGITGLWQVSGRNNTTYEERVRFDAYYVLNWSPWLDVFILIKTVVTIVRRTGAY
jgi:Undecaprenyl-phosphate galactose phosphotransferase WbaP